MTAPKTEPCSRKQTPLYAEDLLQLLEDRSVCTVAGFNGSCDRVVSLDGLKRALHAHITKETHEQAD